MTASVPPTDPNPNPNPNPNPTAGVAGNPSSEPVANTPQTATAPPGNTNDRTGSGGGGNNGDGSGGNNSNSDGSKDGDANEPDSNVPSLTLPFLGKGVSEYFTRLLRVIVRILHTVWSFLNRFVTYWFADLPAPLLTALVGAAASLWGFRIKASYEKVNRQRLKEEKAMRQEAEAERQLREVYVHLTTPVLQAAAKLADRLYVLVDKDWNSPETDGEEISSSSSSSSPNSSPSSNPSSSSMLYSAYLVARYFATVELLKSERPLLDYGFPAADRMLYNILGRVQGLFCANDVAMLHRQSTEMYFEPPPGGEQLPGGLLKITPRAQTDLGQMLLRRVWSKRYKFVSAGEAIGSQAILSFREFAQLHAQGGEMERSMAPILADFKKLEAVARTTNREGRRSATVGSRVFFVQSALVDLVGFFDPLPDTRTVPLFRRRRLQIKLDGDGVTRKLPRSLVLLFRELSLFRDLRGSNENSSERLSLPYGVEVYISGRGLKPGQVEVTGSEIGECASSQRVLMVLYEMGVPHKTIPIMKDKKPSWYYLLHPDNWTPVMYHKGQVLDEPSHIITYLQTHFPKSTPLASAEHLDLRLNTKGLTKFHPAFVRWLEGDESAKASVEHELRNLDEVLENVKIRNNGAPFMGGKSFSSEDTAIVPYLHHVDVAGRALKNWQIPVECKTLNLYLAEARQVKSFVKSVASDQSVVEGYRRMVSAGLDAGGSRLQDML